MNELSFEPEKCKELLRILFEKYQGDQPEAGLTNDDVCQRLGWTRGEERGIGIYLRNKKLVTRVRFESPSIRFLGGWEYIITVVGIDVYLNWDEKSGKEEKSKRDKELIKAESKTARFPTPPGTKWENVKIWVIDGDHLKVSVAKIYKTYSYAQLGMMKVRSSKKSKLWNMLLDLAEHGSIDWHTPSASRSVKKRISDLRKILREVMGLTGDPFLPYNLENCYQPKFDLEDKR